MKATMWDASERAAEAVITQQSAALRHTRTHHASKLCE